MSINEVYQIVNYIANKDQSGNTFKPEQFNLLAKVAQLDFINKRLGNLKALGPQGTPPFGYRSVRKVHEDLRPLVVGPITIPIAPNTGLFMYPYGYLWPDAIHKNDFSQINEVAPDEYPRVKHNTVYPPTAEYPVVVHRGVYGFVDPYTIGSFSMSYVQSPPDPKWGYTPLNGEEVWDPTTSVDFQVNPRTNAHFEIALLILSMVGVNLSMPQLLTQYAEMKEKTTG
jgi:hypothetical protein